MRDLQDVDSLLLKELKSCCATEYNFLPRETGLKLMESASTENHSGVSAKCRDTRVEELWSLTSFFGYCTQTFVQAVNLLDRFLTIMKVQPKHLPCIGVCCLHIAAKMVEEESNVSPTHELIRISQSKFTVSDLCRMEKIISEKLSVEPKAVTALTFLHLYYSAFTSLSAGREEIPSIGRLEAQLKACLCRLVFSKAKPSVLALALIAQEFEAPQSVMLLKTVQQFQRHVKMFPVFLLLFRSVTVSYSTGRNMWPSAWWSTARANATNQTTKSLFGSCQGGRLRISKLVTSVCPVCQLFPREAGMKARARTPVRT
uniref:Cyclin-like domain-containing protein n=1 Tax=Astatotilapia calliptera TaxID=8154 RepID=A0A3P8QLY1_ASTCA